MAALLVALSVMGIMLGAALPVWRTTVQREREAELVFRGEQYVQAIELFSRRTGGFPITLNALRDGRFIRKLYKDPITNTDFQPVYLGQVTAGAPTSTGLQPQQPGRATAVPGVQGQQQNPQGVTPQLTATPPQMPFAAGRGQFPASGFPQTAVPAAGPIIGVSSRSTAQSLRLYNGRGHYNEWLFVSTAATRQAGGPAGAQQPGTTAPGRGGRGAQPLAPGRGRGPGLQLPSPGGPNRGFPLPPAPGSGTPFGAPNTPQPSGQGQRGRL
jgi:type II secretory pathway pseudopilin PulG